MATAGVKAWTVSATAMATMTVTVTAMHTVCPFSEWVAQHITNLEIH